MTTKMALNRKINSTIINLSISENIAKNGIVTYHTVKKTIKMASIFQLYPTVPPGIFFLRLTTRINAYTITLMAKTD